MGALKDIFTSIMVDATPEERARLFRLAFRIFVSVYITWALGMFSSVGFNGVARAADIDDKIQSAIVPLRAEIGAVSAKITAQDETLKEIRLEQIASQLRDLQSLRCKADPDGRDRMDTEIEVAQRKYRALAGERYPLPPCELGK